MSHRILLCDDELHILRAAEFKFRRAGFEVACASDGEEAWQIINQQIPDVVVTDYQMPRLDGLALIRRLRSDEKFAALPIVMLTAKGFELSERQLQQELAITAILAKPFSPRELLAAVSQIVDAACVTAPH